MMTTSPSAKAGGAVYLKIRLLLAAVLLVPFSAQAGMIRDAEIEATLRSYANPIFVEAGITPEDVRIFIVGDPAINAFVAGGLNMFIHTGLIKAAPKPSMVIGVIAHETGHLAGAHLSQLSQKTSRATIGSIIGTVIGAATIAGGGGEAGAGIIMGSQNMALRNLLSGIRVNEESADHAALSYLDSLGISASGMLEMFEVLRRNERGTQRDPYLQSHPLTQQRISTMRNHVRNSEIAKDAVPSSFAAMHDRMLAKLIAFTEPYETTLRRYPKNNTSVAARYGRAIAEYRNSNPDAALALIESLIAEYPEDPFFYDTKGQILFENARISDALSAYQKAYDFMPNSALILTDYAKTMIAMEKPELLAQAITLLTRATSLDDSNGFTWRQLAIAYGKQGKLGESYLALAQEAAVSGQPEEVLQQVKRAKEGLRDNEAALLEADDLARDAEEQIRKQKETNSLF